MRGAPIVVARVVGALLAVAGGGGSVVLGLMARDGFHGLQWGQAWPAAIVMAWLGVCGAGLCAGARWVVRATLAWVVAALLVLGVYGARGRDTGDWDAFAWAGLIALAVAALMVSVSRWATSRPS